MKTEARPTTQQALGTEDGKRYRRERTPARVSPMHAANACGEAHLDRMERGESTPDDAPEYGKAFIEAALRV